MVTNCLNYTTNYYYSINSNELTFKNYICFAELYGKTNYLLNLPDNYGKLGVKIYFSKELNSQMYDNYCLLNDEELKEYLLWIKKTTGFNLKVSNKIQIDDHIEDLNYKILSVKYTKKYPYEIKLIAALIRNLYEFPYNVMIKSALLMKNNEEFQHLDYTQRFCISVNSISGYNTGHSIFTGQGTDLYDNKSIRKRYLKAKKSERNVEYFMYKRKDCEFNRIYMDGHDRSNNDEDDEKSIFDCLENNYISDEIKDIFIKNYKIIKRNYE
jgi:hypothetical protein